MSLSRINLLLGLALVCSVSPVWAQSNMAKQIQANAINIPDRTGATPALVSAFREKQAILIGEMHGTKEPAEFAQGVVETLLSQHKSVVLGIETEDDKSGVLLRSGQLDSLKSCWNKLFLRDGRHSQSWLDLVWLYRQHPNVTVVLFDQTKEQVPRWSRDRSMAENLLAVLRQHPEAVLVTLSGNIHNQLQPYNGTETMGYFLHSLPDSPLKKENLVTTTHFYGAGTMINSQGDGMKLRQVPDNSGGFSTAVPFSSYFLITNLFPMWNALLFTRTVTAAEAP